MGFPKNPLLDPKIQDGGTPAIMQIVKSTYLNQKSSRFVMKFDTQQHIWKSMTTK